jgi:multidrug efflux pump subunit AcrA (membrane-fusion protein)
MNVRALASLIVTALALSACGGGGGGSKTAAAGPPPLVVDVAKVTRQDVATHIALDGQIAPLQQASLGTPESGTIAEVLVNEGDRVAKGQVLAKLDASQLVAQLAANRAAVSQAQARLSGSAIQAPISSQGYLSAEAAAQQNLASAQNRIATAEAALRNAELVNNSDQSLVAQGYVSQTAAEQARANYVSAEREVRNARAALPAAEAALRSRRKSTKRRSHRIGPRSNKRRPTSNSWKRRSRNRRSTRPSTASSPRVFSIPARSPARTNRSCKSRRSMKCM